MILRSSWLLPGLVGLLVALAACGGGGYGGRGGDKQAAAKTVTGAGKADGARLTVNAGDLFLKPKEATAPAGRIEVTYVNNGQIEHTLVMEGKNDLNLKAGKGEQDRSSVELQPGDYTFYCDVPGHRAAGMEMKVHVQ
jgi:plastocyanin